VAALAIASTVASASAAVFIQLLTLMRMAARPCQTVPPSRRPAERHPSRHHRRTMPGFRDAVMGAGRGSGWTGHRGNAPTPFDAVDGARLAGPQGSHPLAAISIDELVRRSSDGLDGTLIIDNPDAVRIGEGISGRLALTARRNINARGAALRLVGGLLAEHQQSREDHDSSGRTTHREDWVEVHGKLFAQEAYIDTPLPTALAAGQRYETPFTIPAPRLGPVSAHLGTAVLAWAIEAKWDVAMGADERLAVPVAVHQNLDYLRSGAVRLENGALFDLWSVGDGSIAVSPLPPIAAGSQVSVTVNWPAAGSGRGGRLELQANIDAPNGIKGVVLASLTVDPAAFRAGATFTLDVPADAPPTVADQGVGVNYRLRALVDRAFRSDLAIERALAIV
jgi:hypothetical protein